MSINNMSIASMVYWILTVIYNGVIKKKMQYGLCNCLYMYCCWRFNYQKGVVIPLSGLSQPYFRACLKPGHVLLLANVILFYEEFEGTKGVIRIRISKKNRQQNGQKKNVQKDKQRSTKHIYITKDRVTRIPFNTGGERKGKQFLLH